MADGGGPDGFLGVRRSLGGRRWRARPADPEVVRAHQRELGLAEPLARALASRGLAAGEGALHLTPTLRELFPDPSSFADMDLAARLLVDALEAETEAVVFADYDVDGASSAALLVRWFRAMGRKLPIYVPDRLTEGFGPTPEAFRRLFAEGARLVVTVDCGAAAADAIAVAAEIGLQVVVIDHHLMREVPPGAAALVNPNRPDCGSGQGALAAAGVTFVLLAALNREARRRGLFAQRPEPDLRRWLDLAALGAICDVTRLMGFNRALAAQGLKAMATWSNPGLAALMDSAGADRGRAGVFEAGYVLGPRINAGGRIGRSDLGATLLSSDDPATCQDLAAQLEALNVERRAVERAIFEEAVESLERQGNEPLDRPAIVVARETWHPGVVGIVASRLRERYRRPVIVLGIDPQSRLAKGSGRSQPGVNLGRAVVAAFDEGLLLAGGGHAMAAGMTLRADTIPEFTAWLCEALAEESRIAEAVDALDIDALTGCGAAAQGLLDLFARLEPFGPGAPEPVVALADVRIERAEPVRGGHVRCTVVDGYGGRLKAIAWRAGDTPVGRRLLAAGPSVHLAGRLKRDDWNGRSGVQLEIEDVAEGSGRPEA
ncbi:MAG TPA: single-stranded-DNA-specific exonuclease RecJ [Caulobacteraceae bacterium]|nr:single-stranded-DNA-specific exonuclease RecJ [Caulobacteraceae bacterium]